MYTYFFAKKKEKTLDTQKVWQSVTKSLLSILHRSESQARMKEATMKM